MAEALRRVGAVPILFPVLTILDVEDKALLLDIATRLDEFDIAVFVSPNAINKALDIVLPRRPWPAATRAATMGKSSERELAQYGIRDVIAPQERFDSESLLALPELGNVQGKKIVVFRGDGGRELLGETLAARGATIEYVECYRRARPDHDVAPLMKLWSDGQMDAITLTSSEGMRNFYEMIGQLGHAWLRKTPVFVPHERIAEGAHALGLKNVIITGPGDDGLIAGLLQHFQTHESESSH